LLNQADQNVSGVNDRFARTKTELDIFDECDMVFRAAYAQIGSMVWRFPEAQCGYQKESYENQNFETEGSITYVIRLDRFSIGAMASQFQQVLNEAMRACAGLQVL
jgi:hypothetical protein